MNALKILIYIIIGVVIISSVSAATIYGTVYDLSLRKVSNVRVEINTSPRQFFIAQNGSYSFNVPIGAYMIKAQLMQKNNVFASAEENITVNQDGDYVLDMILFPNVEEGLENVDIESSNITSIPDAKSSKSHIFIFGIILIAAIILIIIYFYFKYKKSRKHKENIQKNEYKNPDEENELDKLIEIIKKEGGRTTQKEIRKQIPLSEAKISLMIAELEHKGIVEKIKKGRGNIIILKKVMKIKDFLIGKGNLAGKGVYAGRDFRKGDVIIKYHLKSLTKEEFNNLSKKEKIFTHTHNGIINLYSEPERFVNHSNNPNTYQDSKNKCDVALRDIKKGEKITTNATKDDY